MQLREADGTRAATPIRRITLPAFLVVVLPLYLSYGAMGGFIQVAVPTMLQAGGLAVEATGLLGLLFLPFGLSALWAPFVDRREPFGLGRRRGWIVVCQAVIVGCLGLIALAGPGRTGALVALLAVIALATATMDVAIDGFLAETATAQDQAVRGGTKAAGMLIGMVVGSMLALSMLDRAGWAVTLLCLAAIVLSCTLPFALRREARADHERLMRSLRLQFPPGAGPIMILTALVGFALGVGATAPRLIMGVQGYSLLEIGTVFGPLVSLSALLGAILITVLAKGIGLPAALTFSSCLFLAATTLVGLLFQAEWRSLPTISAAVLSAMAGYSAIYACLCARAIAWVRPSEAATDYALVQSSWNLSVTLGTSLSGLLLVVPPLALFVGAGAVAVLGCRGWLALAPIRIADTVSGGPRS